MIQAMGRTYYEKGDIVKVDYFGNNPEMYGTVVDAEVRESQVYSEDGLKLKLAEKWEDENGEVQDFLNCTIKPQFVKGV